MGRDGRDRAVAILLLMLAAALWGGNFIAGRALAGALPPIWLNTLRWGVAALVLTPFLARSLIIHWRGITRCWGELTLLSLIGVVLFNSVLYTALGSVSAASAGLAFALSPFAVALFETALTGRRPAPVLWVAGPLAAIGVALAQPGVNGAGTLRAHLIPVVGFVMLWALYTVLLKRCACSLPVGASFYVQVLIGLALLAPMAAVAAPAPDLATLDWASIGTVLYLGVGAAAVAFLAWQSGVRRLGPMRAPPFVNLVPVFTLVFSAVLLSEAMTPRNAAGVGCVLVALALTLRRGAPRQGGAGAA